MLNKFWSLCAVLGLEACAGWRDCNEDRCLQVSKMQSKWLLHCFLLCFIPGLAMMTKAHIFLGQLLEVGRMDECQCLDEVDITLSQQDMEQTQSMTEHI